MGKRTKPAIAGAVVAAVLILLAVMGRLSANSYYVTPAELKAKGQAAFTEDSRVAGQVVRNSLNWNQSAGRFEFKIAQPGRRGRLDVIYPGLAPDAFQDESRVMVEGRLDPSGTFTADTLLVRCPENYLPEKAAVGGSKLLGAEGLLYR